MSNTQSNNGISNVSPEDILQQLKANRAKTKVKDPIYEFTDAEKSTMSNRKVKVNKGVNFLKPYLGKTVKYLSLVLFFLFFTMFTYGIILNETRVDPQINLASKLDNISIELLSNKSTNNILECESSTIVNCNIKLKLNNIGAIDIIEGGDMYEFVSRDLSSNFVELQFINVKTNLNKLTKVSLVGIASDLSKYVYFDVFVIVFDDNNPPRANLDLKAQYTFIKNPISAKCTQFNLNSKISYKQYVTEADCVSDKVSPIFIAQDDVVEICTDNPVLKLDAISTDGTIPVFEIISNNIYGKDTNLSYMDLSLEKYLKANLINSIPFDERVYQNKIIFPNITPSNSGTLVLKLTNSSYSELKTIKVNAKLCN